MPCNYDKLRSRIREKYHTQDAFAKELKIGRTSLNLKLSGKSDFKRAEIIEAAKLLEIPKNDITLYFFDLKV